MSVDGLVVPSLLDQKHLTRKRAYDELAAQGLKERDIGGGRFTPNPRGVNIGQGLEVRNNGQVVQTERRDAPSKMEVEDIADRFNRFLEWERGEGITQAPPGASGKGLVTRATDPSILPQPYASPADFTNEFGVPVDTTELIALCEETSLYQAIPEVINGSNTESWREVTALAFLSGTNYIAFEAGGCPEEYSNTSEGRTVGKKHIGAKKTLSESDITHSVASIAAGYGMRELIGPAAAHTAYGEGIPSLLREAIRDLKEKEIKMGMILTLNGWDELLVKGSATANAEEFSGIETLVTSANGARVNPNNSAYSGTFSATRFDEWLAAGCAKPTHILGHPTAIQALKVGYWGLGSNTYSNAQLVNWNGPASQVMAGLTFSNVIQTSVGDIMLITDSRFSRTDNSNGSFSSSLFAMRFAHNGEPLVYRATQIPLQYKDLAPGCSAISFMVWAVTALVVKWYCTQGRYTANFNGLSNDGCSWVHDTEF